MSTAHVPRRLILTLRLGELPEHVPSLREVREDGASPATRIDGGVIDRLLAHHGGRARSVRLHSARVTRKQRPGVPGTRRLDDVEQLSGVARVLRVEVAEDRGVAALAEALAQVATVERAAPDRLCSTPFYERAPGNTVAALDPVAARRPRALIRLPQALAVQPGDPSVVVGLADTGVAHRHAELAHRLRRGFDTVDLGNAEPGLQSLGTLQYRGGDPDDEVGHGSACAGILRANGLGVPSGGMGLCGLTPVRVLGAALQDGRRVGVGALADIDAGMKRLIDLGVRVINMSFGTPESALSPSDPRPHEEVVRYARARGVILVAASGNSGAVERYYPAALPGVIAVGAVDDSRRVCRFSSRGAHVAFCAPGRDIWTCGLEGYTSVSGTSFAAPFASAVCALLVAQAAARAWPLDPDQACDLLTESARPFPQPIEGCGTGVLDAEAALEALNRRIDGELGLAN
jgi:subtilisin family serine protease